MSGERIGLAAGAYAAGLSCRQIAAHHDVAESTIRRWLLSAGVTLRPPGRPASAASDVEIATLIQGGMSLRQVASRVGMSASGVRLRHRRIAGL